MQGSVNPATVALLFRRRRGAVSSGDNTPVNVSDKPPLDASGVSDVLQESLRFGLAFAAQP